MLKELIMDFPEDAKLNGLYDRWGKLFQQGQFKQSINIANEMRKIYETKYGQEITSRYSGFYFNTLYNLGFAYKAANDYSNAESLYLDTLEFLREVLGENSSMVGSVLADLGGLYYVMGEESKSKDLYIKALKILDKDEEKRDVYRIVLKDFHSKFSW
jgi:tetratricopeptide (TPR) repeat protein